MAQYSSVQQSGISTESYSIVQYIRVQQSWISTEIYSMVQYSRVQQSGINTESYSMAQYSRVCRVGLVQKRIVCIVQQSIIEWDSHRNVKNGTVQQCIVEWDLYINVYMQYGIDYCTVEYTSSRVQRTVQCNILKYCTVEQSKLVQSE